MDPNAFDSHILDPTYERTNPTTFFPEEQPASMVVPPITEWLSAEALSLDPHWGMGFHACDHFSLSPTDGMTTSALLSEEPIANDMEMRTMEWPLPDAQDMTFDAHDLLTMEPIYRPIAPTALPPEDLITNDLEMQAIEWPSAEAQNLGPRQVDELTPYLDPMQLTPLAPTVPTTCQVSVQQQVTASPDDYPATGAAPMLSEQPVVKRTQWRSEPKEEDWKRMRPKITELYRDQDYTLEEVMAAMEQAHKFKARYARSNYYQVRHDE